MIEKEFVTYEQALALKELGFDEPCFKYIYIGDTGINVDHYLEVEPSKARNYNVDNLSISQPTFSQAFRWFREKHNLYHDIRMFGDWDKPQFSYIVSGRTMTNPSHMWYYEDENSYEEAELACLDKIIEIVKSEKELI